MTEVRPFSIHVADEVLADLKDRLARTRWPDSIPGAGWDEGADLAYVKGLCQYWREGYDWRAHEGHLNRWPQFMAEVDGVDFHFWHVKGKGPNPFPLLLVHGWPGSMFEFYHLIGRLTDPAAHGGDARDSFDVVIPALPGYGWSGKPTERGWGPSRTATAFNRLMTDVLGYERYGTQGGDWGGIITARMGAAHPEQIAGCHLNFLVGQPPPSDESEGGKAAAAERQRFVAEETAYSQLQGTKPMSLAIAQADSPAGIAAWIVEKFRTWSDCGGDIESVYTKDQLLTNIMFYWAPNSIVSAARMYYESRRDAGGFGDRVAVPVAAAVFPKEIYRSPRHWLEGRFNIQRWTEFDKGGHFAAMERPKELLEDMRAFFRTVR
ncbi:MAG: epoxide hydrolase [Dehalococcoidia bacterium]|nr:epoxide hydrolase [Dehalococcoidia bacterium]